MKPFCLFFLLIFSLCVIVSAGSTSSKIAVTSGPFRTMLIRVQKCNQTTYPLEKNPPIVMNLEVYNTTTQSFLLRGNITVLRENKQLKVKMKSFIWRNNKWKLTYLLNNIGCHSLLLHMMTTAMGLNYDRESCGLTKGTYAFKDINPDTIQHMWAPKMEYGHILWISETIMGSTTYICHEYETLVEPLKT